MKELTQADRDRLWQDVVAEFPDDQVMQEVHFARLVHGEMLRDESPENKASFFREEAAKLLGSDSPVTAPAK